MNANANSKIRVLFLFPLVILFCAFFLPLSKYANGISFRGVELLRLCYGGTGNALSLYLYALMPLAAMILIVLTCLGNRLVPLFSLVLGGGVIVLSLAIYLVGYEQIATHFNSQGFDLPLPPENVVSMMLGKYIGVGALLALVAAVFLVVYSLWHMASGGKAQTIVYWESAVNDSIRQNIRQYMMIIALLGIWGIFYVLTQNGIFMASRNLSNLFLQSAASAVVAIGVVLILVTLNIDLSIGSVVGFIGAIAAVIQVDSSVSTRLANLLTTLGIPVNFMAIVAIVAAILIGILIGAWHGMWIAYLGVPAFIVTLSSMMVFRGGILYFTGGKSIYNMYPWFQAIGHDYVPPSWSKILTALIMALYVIYTLRRRRVRVGYGFPVSSMLTQIVKLIIACAAIGVFFGIMISYRGIPYAWLIVMVMMVIFTFIAEKTTFGRHLYAIGGNPDAARLSGIDIKRKILYLYVIFGFITSIGAIIYLSRLNAATANSGNGMELDCIASAVIGGTSLAGGEGFIFGGVVGALVMGSLDNGMSLMNLDATWQYIVKGLVLLLAVWVDMATRKRSST